MALTLVNTQFIQAIGIGFLGAVSPGPDFVLVSRNSFISGRKAGILTSLGTGLGILVHCTYCALGVTVLLAKFPSLLNILRWAGAGYLIYIGIKSVQSLFSSKRTRDLSGELYPRDLVNKGARSSVGWIKMGLLTNILNPKAALFMLGLTSQVTQSNTNSIELPLFAILMASFVFGWFTFISSVATIKIIKSKLMKAQDKIDQVFGFILIACGIVFLIYT